MSSPTKKRKLNNRGGTAAAQPKGLEYFFSKPRQAESSRPAPLETDTPNSDSTRRTDEELARKLLAEYDLVVANGATEDGGSTKVKAADKGPAKVEKDDHAPEVLMLSSKKDNTDLTGESNATPERLGKTLALQSTGTGQDTVTSSMPLDESPLVFDPSRYVTQLQEHWAADGGNASYGLLTRCFVLVNATTSRTKIVDTLVNCLRVLIEADPSSLLPAVSSMRGAIGVS